MDVVTSARLTEADMMTNAVRSDEDDISMRLFHSVVTTKFIYPYCPYLLKTRLPEVSEQMR